MTAFDPTTDDFDFDFSPTSDAFDSDFDPASDAFDAATVAFDFDDPNAELLEANFPYAWDPAEAAKYAELRAELRRAKIPNMCFIKMEAGTALIEAKLDGQIELDELLTLSRHLESGNDFDESYAMRRAFKLARRREKARARMAILIAEASPEKLEDRAKSHRKSAAKYRAAHRGELKHKEWRRRPQNAAWLKNNAEWNLATGEGSSSAAGGASDVEETASME